MFAKASLRRASAVVLGAATVAGVAVVGTGAFFTDQATITGNTFTTGSVDISTTPTSAALTLAGIMPGDSVVAPITVNNLGTSQLRYAMKSVTTEDVLASALQLTAVTGLTAGNCTAANFGSGTPLTLQGSIIGSVAGTKIIGDAAQGAQTGDRVLDGTTNEVICFKVSLPTSATTGQGITTTATFTFDAEQTKNN